MRPSRVGILLAAVLLASACGGEESSGGRERAPSCGTYVVPLGELSAEARAIRNCFLDAFRTGEVAEVTITTTTIEGEPIVTTYRVLARDEVDLFVDASADTFANPKTYRQRCTAVAEEGGGLAATGCVIVS